jgi:hypothetical protein
MAAQPVRPDDAVWRERESSRGTGHALSRAADQNSERDRIVGCACVDCESCAGASMLKREPGAVRFVHCRGMDAAPWVPLVYAVPVGSEKLRPSAEIHSVDRDAEWRGFDHGPFT